MTRVLNISSIAHFVNKNGIKKLLRAQPYVGIWKPNCTRPLSDDTQNKDLNVVDKKYIIGDKYYDKDAWTNVTPKILSLMNRQLHNEKYHPLQLIKQRITNYMYQRYPGPRGPLFSVHDQVMY